MKIDFLGGRCHEVPRRDAEFGICDDQNGEKAYTDVSSPAKWVATVKNPNTREVTFIAVDKCLVKDTEHKGRGRCDGILKTDEQLYFVELKDQMANRAADAIAQLESTIKFFRESHDLSLFRHKKAFACNKRHRHFQETDNELNKAFFRKHKVRIDVQAEIIVL